MTDREVCEHNRRICDPCDYCGTARNRKSNPTGGEIRPPIIYNESDPFVYCGFCQATFRTDPMDATCRLCGHFFRDMGHLGHSDDSPLIKEINALQAENESLKIRYKELEERTGQTGKERLELLAENERLKKEMEEQCRLLGKGGEREAKLESENKRLREFIAHVHKDKCECPSRGNEGCFHWADRCRAEILSAVENKGKE